jgi:hypothetical protein
LLEAPSLLKISGRYSKISWNGKNLIARFVCEPFSCYVKSMESIWRRLNDVNLKLPEEFVVFMTLMSLSLSLGTQIRILESRKDISKEIMKKVSPTTARASCG